MRLSLAIITLFYSAMAVAGGPANPTGSNYGDTYRFSLQGEERLLQAAARSYMFPETGNSGIRAVARQPDNKIVAVGFAYSKELKKRTFAIARYLENGQHDEAFGNKGTVLPQFGKLDNIATAVAIQPDGGILVGGYATVLEHWRIMIVIRLKPNGEMDRSFGGTQSGLARIACTAYERCTLTSLALQPDGKIIAGGFRLSLANYSSAMIVARLNANGTSDTSFGVNGQFIDEGIPYTTWPETFNCHEIEHCERRAMAGRQCEMTTVCDTRWRNNADKAYVNLAYSLLVLPNGNIVIGGGKFYETTHYFYLLQISASGERIAPDKDSFNVVHHNHGQFMVPFFVSLRGTAEGKILALGTILSKVPGESGMALFRFNGDGSLDTTFGPEKSGYLVVPVGEDGGFAFGLVEQTDGKVIVAGHAQSDGAYNLGAFRSTAEGEIDVTFAKENNGIVTRPIPVKEALGVAALCHSHGKFVVAGQEINANGGTSFLLARFWGGECK